ncbi:MAG: thioredoxin [Bacteroidota bacterium]
MKEITDVKSFNDVVTQDKPVLLDFYADWCGPCKSLLPIVEKLADKYEDEFEVRKINVDKNPAIAQQFKVRSIPALFVVKDRAIKKALVGYQSESALEKVFQEYVVTA